MKRFTAIILLLAACVSAAAARDRAALDGMTVHLFLEKSGQLSPDVTAIADFKSWNGTPMGAGIPDGETFEALLIKVRFVSKGEVFAKGRQATVTVTNTKTRKTILRRRIADVYVDSAGKITKAVFLSEASCTPLTITVRGGGRTLTKKLDFECGE